MATPMQWRIQISGSRAMVTRIGPWIRFLFGREVKGQFLGQQCQYFFVSFRLRTQNEFHSEFAVVRTLRESNGNPSVVSFASGIAETDLDNFPSAIYFAKLAVLTNRALLRQTGHGWISF